MAAKPNVHIDMTKMLTVGRSGLNARRFSEDAMLNTAGERQLKVVAEPNVAHCLPDSMKQEGRLHYDPVEINLTAAVSDLLELQAGSSLEQYETEEDQWTVKGRKALQAKLRAHDATCEAYHRLVREVVGPHLLEQASYPHSCRCSSRESHTVE